ncbi:MAG TPA: electron transport complex subunit RsxE [Treponemataceae bacterium]|nr:electron transport complex subunit RsxE [Treponemataceae bacterium]
MKKYLSYFTNGILRENPLLMLMIGLCSALAVTTSLANGIGMGIAMTFVLLMSEIIISAFRSLIPQSIRIPVFIIVIAAFTTIVDLVMKAFTPELSKAMGVFIPLIVVNCIIMGRVESFSYKRTITESIADALGMGLGYTWVLCSISFIRELLGAGTILGMEVLPESIRMGFFAQSPGGFFVFGLMIAVALAAKKALERKGGSR